MSDLDETSIRACLYDAVARGAILPSRVPHWRARLEEHGHYAAMQLRACAGALDEVTQLAAAAIVEAQAPPRSIAASAALGVSTTGALTYQGRPTTLDTDGTLLVRAGADWLPVSELEAGR